ncbi:hypothetical protein DZC72_04320 [Maribacter algicola]|uniref:Uncharacterized protein n=1 Tax=Maribacter algicola TaxID=2498892 RepID=A0A426RLF0_9FLAO|nr:hypothetical protein [Maribacter algicola]RRQ49821.1 hypothetical protein DZC72_04320 [Maribacter algicola]
MEDIFKTETTNFFKITKGFSSNMELFYIEVTYKNKLGKPYAIYEWLDTEPENYRRINTCGAYSEMTFDTLLKCIQYDGEQII